jgi:hypothetical protein
MLIYILTFGVICKPDVVLGNEELKAESSNPGKEVRILLMNVGMLVTKPEKTYDLKEQERTFTFIF